MVEVSERWVLIGREMVVGSDFPLAVPIHALITVGNVEEKVLFMMFLVQQSHGSWGGWNDVVYKEEESILGSQVDSFPNEEVKLAHCQIRRDEVFLLVQISYSGFWGFLHNNLKTNNKNCCTKGCMYQVRATSKRCVSLSSKKGSEKGINKASVKRALKYV